MEDGRQSPSLHLDLSNFEDGVSSRYVLTSPRSLEACARLGTRPIQLLYKSLEEVREEHPEVSSQRLNDLYVAQEMERRRKLDMCRQLRMELLQEDCQPDRASSHTSRGHKDSLSPTSLEQRDPRPVCTDGQDPLDIFTRGHRDCSPLFPDQQNPPPLSSDLRVPQGTSTRGHKNCSPLLLPDQQNPSPLSTNHRVPQGTSTRGHIDCSPLFSDQQNPSPLPTDLRVPHSTSTRGHRDCSPLFPDQQNPPPLSTNHRVPQGTSTRGHRDCSPLFPGQQNSPPLSTERRVPQGTSTRGHRDCSPLFPDQQNPPPLSTNHRVPQGTSTRGHRDCSPLFPGQQNPPPLSTERRVPQGTLTRGHRSGLGTLQKSLSQGDLNHMEEKARRMGRTVERELRASLPDRDKKIGALMLLKHQEEEMLKQRRVQAQQAWDNLKIEERYIRAALDRQNLPIQLQNHRRRSWSSQLDWQMDPVHMSPHRTQSQEQKAFLKYGLTKAMVDLRSKNIGYENASDHPLEERMIKAFKVKMVKDLQEKKNIQIKNEYEKLRHSKLKEKVDNQAKAEEHVKRVSIQQKELKSQELKEKLVEERNKDLYEKASREDELKLMAKLRAMRLEKEQMEHKKMLTRLTDHKIQQAKDNLDRSMLGKAKRAQELNFIKESAHQALKKKVDREKENQRMEIVQTIKIKDQKSERIQKEKEAINEEGRRVARASFHFRDKIREQTKSRTFDQMALQATLNASLLKTIP